MPTGMENTDPAQLRSNAVGRAITHWSYLQGNIIPSRSDTASRSPPILSTTDSRDSFPLERMIGSCFEQINFSIPQH